MSMLIPGQNQLVEPSIVTVEAFEDLLAEFKTFVIEYVGARAPERAAKLKVSLDNESELLTLALEAFCVRLQIHERKYNARIKQMLAWWATGSNLDARLADMGLERQLLDPGDPLAFPPIAPVFESDDDARLRYYLAPHAPAAGSRMQYRREVFTLGERPAVNVETSSPGVVNVTYRFDPDGYAAQVKDGNGRRTAPGEVMVTVLSREGDGTASENLLDGVRQHFARPDVRPETDLVTVQAAQIKNYKIRVVAKINAGPDSGLTRFAAQEQLQAYADSCHRLEGRVDPSWIDYTLHSAGAVQLEILEPVTPIVTTAFQAPYCTGVEVEVDTL
jgi:phage-related baseplate assembly protein